MEGLKEGKLEIKVSEGPAKTVITWFGQSDAQKPSDFLTPYFTELITNFKGGEIEADFSELSYMNSSTVYPTIQFLKMADTKSIKTTVMYKGGSVWQNATFRALETMSNVLKNVTILRR